VVLAALVVVAATAASCSSAPGSSAPAAPVRLASDPFAHAAGATTLAGTGTPGFSGDGGPATDARLNAPSGVAMDRSGNLFIADTGNCRVREVPARTGHSFGIRVHAGDIVTIAGGPCTGSKPNPAPTALALDPAGDLFIAYSTGARVAELPATTGRLVTIAGTGVSGYGGDSGPAPRSVLDDPSGLAVDPSGDLLIADTGNCRLRLVAASTGTRFGVSVVAGHIYTVAGTGICGSDGGSGPALSAQLWDPGALAVDSGGNALFADQGSRSIRLLAATTGRYYGVTVVADHLGTVAGEGSYGPYLVDGLSAVGETAELNFPTALAVDGQGNLSIADGAMHAIRVVPAVTTTLLGKTVTADNMYTAAGAMGTGGLRDGTSWIQTRLLQPAGLTLSTDGALIYSDSQANVVRQLPVGR
jgi:sugar lactone lactonase YvrE